MKAFTFVNFVGHWSLYSGDKCSSVHRRRRNRQMRWKGCCRRRRAAHSVSRLSGWDVRDEGISSPEVAAGGANVSAHASAAAALPAAGAAKDALAPRGTKPGCNNSAMTTANLNVFNSFMRPLLLSENVINNVFSFYCLLKCPRNRHSRFEAGRLLRGLRRRNRQMWPILRLICRQSDSDPVLCSTRK